MLVQNKILVVDDDPEDQEIFMTVLKEINPACEFKTAGNGAEAIEMLSKENPLPSCILLDINMPLMNGLECLKFLRQEEKYDSISIVMLTTSKDPPTVKSALKMGAQFFLTKASSLHDIKIQLQQVVANNLSISF